MLRDGRLPICPTENPSTQITTVTTSWSHVTGSGAVSSVPSSASELQTTVRYLSLLFVYLMLIIFVS